MNESKLRKTIGTERQRILQSNLDQFDAITKDYGSILMKVNTTMAVKLANRLWKLIEAMRRMDMSMLPPPLLRRRGDSVDEWLDSCYEAGVWTKR